MKLTLRRTRPTTIPRFLDFSKAGFMRLFERTGWEVCAFRHFGNVSDSDPIFSEHVSSKDSLVLGTRSIFVRGRLATCNYRYRHIAFDCIHSSAQQSKRSEPRAGSRVTAAWKGGSPDIEESAKRVDKFSAELKDKWGVKFVDSISSFVRNRTACCLRVLTGDCTWTNFARRLNAVSRSSLISRWHQPWRMRVRSHV